jgi:hypothetical protein
VLTAREHLTRRDCHAHLRQLRRSLRKRWPSIEWFVQVEFQRRGALHLNLLIKGVDAHDQDELLERASGLWCSRVDAEPAGQWIGTVQDAGGLARYLAKTLGHGLKAEQAPPLGWRGHRTSQTRGYLVRSAAQLRDEARSSLRRKDALNRAIRAGHQGPDAELVAGAELDAAAAASWVYFEAHLLRNPGWVRARLEAGPSTPPAARGAADPRRGPLTAGPAGL